MQRSRLNETPGQRLRRSVPAEIAKLFRGTQITMDVAKAVEDSWRAYLAEQAQVAAMLPTVTPKELSTPAIKRAIAYLKQKGK